jgi:two-component system sensor histidine kinase PhoQ
MPSLNSRLLFSGSVVLAAFLGLTGLALDQAFRNAAQTALRDRLEGHIYALLAVLELGADAAVHLQEELPDPRLGVPESGLYAKVVGRNGSQLWRSASAEGLRISYLGPLLPGQRRFYSITASDGTPLLALSFGVAWETPEGEQDLTFSVAQSLSSYQDQVASFRRSLGGWLTGAALLLLLVQGAILHWGLAPVRRVRRDLAAVERGEQDQLGSDYPAEIEALADSINAFIRHERAGLQRYRDTLGDLAHSLKTPLTVLRTTVDSPETELRAAVAEQVARMTQIVDYQLGRAATSGRTPLAAPLEIAAIVRKMATSLDKVYADKGVALHLEVETGTVFQGDEGDLYEILGNLLDNAYKWCQRRVHVTVTRIAPRPRRQGSVMLVVEDDGPGVPQDQAARITERGVRADPTVTGHGIGLAVVQDIARLYGGELEVGQSLLGGACMTVRLSQP